MTVVQSGILQRVKSVLILHCVLNLPETQFIKMLDKRKIATRATTVFYINLMHVFYEPEPVSILRCLGPVTGSSQKFILC